MDLCLSLAVSSAWYFTEHWQNLVKKSEVVSSMDKKNDKKSGESESGIFCRLIRRQEEEDVSFSNHKVSSNSKVKSLEKQADASLEGVAYSSVAKGDTLMSSDEYVRDHSSLLSLQPWIFRKESYQNDEEKIKVNGEFSDTCGYESNRFRDASQAELSPRNVSLGYGRGRGRSSLRSRRSLKYSVKPVTSAENCLIPQLYNEHFEIEEYVFSSVPSSAAPTVRPLIITDGNRIISKSTYDPLGMPFESGLHQEVDGVSSRLIQTVVGVPSLPRLRNPRKMSREVQHPKLDSSNSQRPCKISRSQDSPNGMFLFCLGINIGVISTIISNRREIERLNDMLKQTENLVQDLQEELEMKESLTVKELANEACQSQELNDSCANNEESIDSLQTQVLASHFPAQETDEYDQPHLPKSVGKSELSKIEAELEAELERLELNMNATSLEGRMSALSELDPDLIADVVHGELRADMLNGGARRGQSDANRDGHSTSTTETHNANYVVSPRELSLRLHEVIQFQLEERIKELESALQHNQKQLECMEAEQVLSRCQRAFSNSDMGPSSNQESPTLMKRDSALAQPLCLNLSGDALNAYDEAYEEFMLVADTEENLPSTTNTGKQLYADGLVPSDRSLIWGMEDSSGGKSSIDTQCFERETTWEQMLSRESNDACESNDTDDEEGKRLIQQIVEKTRLGSPVVLHAQRMLFSLDE